MDVRGIMPEFVDLHNHILFQVDDGAKQRDEMERMIDLAYEDGTRYLCFTPYFHPGFFGDTHETIAKIFNLAQEYVSTKYSDLSLYLGNELRYDDSCLKWLRDGICNTINGSRYILVDFFLSEDSNRMCEALRSVLSAGYLPILAHVERYDKLRFNIRRIKQLKSWGTIIQIDAQSPIGGFGIGAKVSSKRLLDAGLVDIIASDAHDLLRRSPRLSPCFRWIAKRYGAKYAEELFYNTPLHVLEGSTY